MRNAQAPYCHLWLALLYNIFPHYHINGTILGKKKLLNTKYKSHGEGILYASPSLYLPPGPIIRDLQDSIKR
jgi:hypothetical protein